MLASKVLAAAGRAVKPVSNYLETPGEVLFQTPRASVALRNHQFLRASVALWVGFDPGLAWLGP